MTSTFGCKAFSPFSLKYHNYHQITNKLEKSSNKKVSIERVAHAPTLASVQKTS